MKELKEYIRNIPDFPEKGIIFRDVTSVLQDADGLKLAIDELAKKYINDIPAFIEFVRNSEFAVVDGYLPSWSFIKQDLRSLERHSNIGICFNKEIVSGVEDQII